MNSQESVMPRCFILASCAAFALATVIGCGGDDKLAVYPVSGTLTIDGEPFGPTSIRLNPQQKGGHSAVGQVDSSGNITFTTYKRGDGLPAGEYQVIAGMEMAPPPKPIFV